jgi:hypothetical protein
MEHAQHFRLEVRQQAIDTAELIRPSFIVLRSVPVVMLHLRLAEARPLCRHPMSVVEPHQLRAVRRVQREGVAQPMRPLRRRRYPLDLELEPVALFEVMDTAIEGQQELERMLLGYGSLG